ncbi:hypothetical protein P9228_20220 [Mesorhizobium sp. WSM4898]|nr:MULTISPECIES: hypothetical protein [unclassified Mesorhizobium]MDG4908755.1 hypothetical protein [Mesorhizobium sp. WSM4898]
MNFLSHVFSGLWAAGVSAMVWQVWKRPSPPLSETEQERDLREWLEGQM